MEDWATFATVVGAAAASLTGLLFVAVSIRIDVIAPSPELRNRAAQTLLLFATALFVSIALAIPDQAHGPLAGEVIALGGIAGAGMIALDRRAQLLRKPARSRSGTYSTWSFRTGSRRSCCCSPGS